MIKNVKYVLINENSEPIKNKNDSLDIKTAEVILENYEEINKFNASNLENSNQQINELQTKNIELTSQIEINNFNNSWIDNEEFKNFLLKSYDINDNIEIIKTQLQSIYDELIKVQTVNIDGVPKTQEKQNNILDTDNVFNK